jgi:hypothetical protein
MTDTEVLELRRVLPVLGQAGELAKAAVPIISARLARLEKSGPPLREETVCL